MCRDFSVDNRPIRRKFSVDNAFGRFKFSEAALQIQRG
jgi:hypothetical protein